MSVKLQNNQDQTNKYLEERSQDSSGNPKQPSESEAQPLRSSDEDEEVDPFGDDQQTSDEKELSLPEEEQSDNSNGEISQIQDEDNEDIALSMDDDLDTDLFDYEKTQTDTIKQELSNNRNDEKPDSPSFAKSFTTGTSLTYKKSQTSVSPIKEQEPEQKRTSLMEKMNQVYSPDKKATRILNPSEIRMLGMSTELRKSLMRQNGWDESPKKFGSPDFNSAKSPEMLKSEQKLITRAKREKQVLEYEAEAKEKKRKEAEELGYEMQKKQQVAKVGRTSAQGEKRMRRRLLFNTFNTNYPVIDLAAKNCGFRTVFKDHNLVPSAELKAAHKLAPGLYSAIQIEEFDVVWFDLTVQPEVLCKIKPHQRLSQWPGISVLSHKNKLGKNLMIMQKHQPKEYDFFPQTYMLPTDMHDYKKQFRRANPENVPTFIVKPSHDCQGRGIYLMKQFDELKDPEQSVVAQTYIDDPFLIDGLKFDLRMYVLLFGIHPLRIYLFDDGLARFATNPYVSAKDGDINDLFTHLTNYAINKLSSAYVQNQEQDGGSKKTQAHKRSLKDIYKNLEAMGKDVDKLKRDINDLIIKTIITGQNSLHHIYRSSQPDDLENQMCFQILGFDIMFDSKLKPWLIEINQSPSFATDSAFDFSLKKKVMEDTFRLLNLSSDRKGDYIEAKEKQYFERMMQANKQLKPSYEQREYQRFQLDKKRDEDERPILAKSGYECIFPIKNNETEMRRYNGLLKLAKEVQDSFIHGKRKPPPEDNVYDIILKAQCKGIPALLPQQRPKTAAAPRSKTITGKKNQFGDIKGSETQALNDIKRDKEESKMKEKILKNQIIQNVKRKVVEQEKKLTFQAQLKEFSVDQSRGIPSVLNKKVKEEEAFKAPKLLSKKEKEEAWKATNPRESMKEFNRDASKTPVRTKTPTRQIMQERGRPSQPTVVRYQEDLSNPYTKNITNHVKKVQPNPYLTSEKEDSERQAQAQQRNKPNLTPLAHLRQRAQQSKTPNTNAPLLKNDKYNPVLADRNKSKTPVRIQKQEEVSDDSEYSGEQITQKSFKPKDIVNKFLTEKGIIREDDSKNVKRYVPLHQRNQSNAQSSTPNVHINLKVQTSVAPKKMSAAVNNFVIDAKEVKSPMRTSKHNFKQKSNKLSINMKHEQSDSDENSDVALENSPNQMSDDQTSVEVDEQINRMISSTYQAESLQSPQPKRFSQEKQNEPLSAYSKEQEEIRQRQISARAEKVARHKEKLNKLKASNRKIQSDKVSLDSDDQPSQYSKNNKTVQNSGFISFQKKKPTIEHNQQASVVDIEIIPPPRTIASKKSKRSSIGNHKKSIDIVEGSDYLKRSLKSPIEFTPDDKKQRSVLKVSDTVSKIKQIDSIFKMDLNSNQNSIQDIMSQSVTVLPKKKSKPTGPPMYERKESLANKSMQKSQLMREMNGLNEHIYTTDQSLNLRLGVSPLKSTTALKKKESPVKKEKLDPSKDFMAKNLEKLVKLQKEKEKEKKEELKKKVEEKDQFGIPTKKDKEKLRDEKQKKENQMIAAKLKFLKLMEDLKSKGKDPVFNLVKDFTVNLQIGQGTFAVIKKCTHNKSKYEIALKTYDKKLLTRKSQLMAIHREIYILAGLEHPNIMKLFEVIDTKSHVNLVQEYCHGLNLYDYIKRHGQKGKIGKNSFYSSYLSEGRAKNIFRQIISAISYMHGLGLVHRDLRIENILINDQTYEIKFIDFGFATSFQQNDKLQMIGGVPQYKNPDVAKNKTINGQIADTYALAIILYIMLTGGVPLWANYDSDLYQQITADKSMLPIGENAYTGQKLEIFSSDAQDLIGKMFQAETKNRMKTQDILKHPWFGLSGTELSGQQMKVSLQNQSTQSSNETKA